MTIDLRRLRDDLNDLQLEFRRFGDLTKLENRMDDMEERLMNLLDNWEKFKNAFTDIDYRGESQLLPKITFPPRTWNLLEA